MSFLLKLVQAWAIGFLSLHSRPAIAGTTLSWEGRGQGSWRPQRIEAEAKITGVEAAANNIGRGGFLDYCVYLSRSAPPVAYAPFTGGFSEIACWSAYYPATTGNGWSRKVDLSGSPIYVPAGTEITCATNYHQSHRR